MDNKIIILVVVLVLAFAAYSYVSSAPSKYDNLAKCLSDKGVKFYGAFWCPHCEEQKQLLGKSMKYINYIECSNPDRSMTKACSDAGISSYPTWEFKNGSRLEGYLPIVTLAQMSGCAIK